jgi:hypothetical protein
LVGRVCLDERDRAPGGSPFAFAFAFAFAFPFPFAFPFFGLSPVLAGHRTAPGTSEPGIGVDGGIGSALEGQHRIDGQR